MRRHSEIGAAILEVHEAMADIARIVRNHHERWDGRGYPDRLASTQIPLGARIIAVADAYSAMTSDRVYRAALPVDRAWAELRAHSGTQFDPEIVAVFEQVVDESGHLRPLDAGLARSLETEVHVPMTTSQEWRDRLALLPVLEPSTVQVKTLPEPCPVAPEGEECAVIASGEGCEIVLPAVEGSAEATA
jgi:hypothetical protein